jgi:hypothetical protein
MARKHALHEYIGSEYHGNHSIVPVFVTLLTVVEGPITESQSL